MATVRLANQIIRRQRHFADARERMLMEQMMEDYQAALKVALSKYHNFLQLCDDVRTGRKPPPQYYIDRGPEAVERWMKGFVTEQLRRGKVVEGIAAELQKAGAALPDRVRDAMADIYTFDHNAAIGLLNASAGVDLGIAGINRRQARILYQARETPLTKIAYQRYGNNPEIERRLRREFLIATTTGEGNRELTRRVAAATHDKIDADYLENGRDPYLRAIKNVARYEIACARRIVQTERTRVSNQATYDVGEEAKALGVRTYNEWSCQFLPETDKSSGSRETHRNADGQKRMQGEWFEMYEGSRLGTVTDRLRYPGDPSGKACNVINCHCTLIPGVLLPDEELDPHDPYAPPIKVRTEPSGRLPGGGQT